MQFLKNDLVIQGGESSGASFFQRKMKELFAFKNFVLFITITNCFKYL